jgi:flagellar hook-length control protein FliK
MNSTPPVSQSPIASDPAQQNSSAPANSVNSGGDRSDFAAALRSAGAKPARRAAAAKPADGSSVGGSLPVAGNLSPPPTPPIAAGGTGAGTAAQAAAGQASAALAVGGPQAASRPTAVATGVPVKVDQKSGGASAGVPLAAQGAQNGASPGNESTQALGLPVAGRPVLPPSDAPIKVGGPGAAPIDSSTAVSGDPRNAASSAAELAQALGLPATGLAEAAAPDGHAAGSAGAAAGTAEPGAAVGGMTAAGSAAAQIAPTGAAAASGAAAAASRAASAAQAGGAPGTARKPMTAAAATAAFNAATSGPSSSDGNPTPATNVGAWTNTDATAQALNASAMAAAATGAAPIDASFAGAADSPSSPIDELAAPAMVGAARGAGRPNGAPALAVAVSVPAAAAAAKAAANAPAVDALADLDKADPRTAGGSGDSPLLDTSGNAAAGAAQLSTNTLGLADAAPTPTLKVAAGMDTPEFGQGLADRVSWMVGNNLNGAKLQVNPPQLGPIEVRIAVQGSHAQVWLTSHSAVTRDALEASSPKLRDMLGAQGFGQVSVDISQRSYQERSSQPQPYDWTPSASRSPAAAVQSTASLLPRTASGALDAYA